MLDKSLPHKPVVMTHNHPRAVPRFPLPEGYRLAHWEPGREKDWCAIETACGEFDRMDAAMERFSWEFLPHPEKLSQRMWFAFAADGSPAGTVTLWTGEHLGRPLPRIHWVATHPDHEGQGVAKGLLSAVIEKFPTLETGSFLYLTSQTWSWPAIRLYKKLGFLPYRGERPAGWKGDWAPEEGWRIIHQKIGEFEAAN